MTSGRMLQVCDRDVKFQLRYEESGQPHQGAARFSRVNW